MEEFPGPAITADLQQLTDVLCSELRRGFADAKECLRDVQTELLKAFHSYAQTTDAKLKDSEQADIALRQCLTPVEMRLTEVKKRLNLPPAA